MSGRMSLAGLMKYSYLLAVAALIPLLKPEMPLSTSVFDYVNVAFMFLVFLYLFARHRFRTRLVFPVMVIFIASLISMVGSPKLADNTVALVQEVYIFLFFLALYNIVETEEDFGRLVGFWFVVAAMEGGLLISEMASAFTERGFGTFRNPNMAGSYLGLSAFLVFQPHLRMHGFFRASLAILILMGVLATKSLSASLALLVGLLVVAFFYWMRGSGARRVKQLVMMAILGLTVMAAFPEFSGMKNFMDRYPRSSGGRKAIFKAGIDTFLGNPMGMGIGPAGFERTVGGPLDPRDPKSLHSDYLSFLVERGVLGFTGLLLLLGSLVAILVRCSRSSGSSRAFGSTLGLWGMLVFILVDAFGHEVLHYRHVWLGIALIAVRGRLTCEVGAAPAGPSEAVASRTLVAPGRL